MSRATSAIAAAAAVLALAATGTAEAGNGTVKATTGVTIEVLSNTASDAVLIGSIGSSKRRCLDSRKVRVTLVPVSGPNFAFDVARTGAGGGWFALRDLDEVEAIAPIAFVKVRVAKRALTLPGGRTLICGAKRLRRAIT